MMPLSTFIPWITCACLCVLSLAAHAQEKAAVHNPIKDVQITVDREVTVFDGPLRADGTIDYFAALNQKHARQVNKHNNAFVPLYLIAPRDELLGETYYDEIDQVLRIQPVDREGVPEYVDGFTFGQNHGLTRIEWAGIFETRVNGPFNDKHGKILAAWIESNAAAYAHIIEGVKLPHYWVPLADDPQVGGLLIQKPDTHAAVNRQFARELRCYANYLAERGEEEQAAETLFAITRLARLQAQEPMLANANNSHAIYRTAYKALIDLLNSKRLSADILATISTQWQDHTPEPMVKEKVATDLRCLVQDSLMQIASGRHLAQRAIFEIGPDSRKEKSFFDQAICADNFDLNLSLKLVKDYFDEASAMLDQARYADYAKQHLKWSDICFQAKLFAGKALVQDKDGELSVQPNLPGDKKTACVTTLVLDTLAVHQPHAAMKVEYECRAKHAASQIAIAIERYRLNRDRLPDSLDDLVPDYLDELPADPYDNKPMRYKQIDMAYRVYAIGENLTDDNGTGDRRDGDVAIEIKHRAAE